MRNSFENTGHEIKERETRAAGGPGVRKCHYYFLEMFARQLSREEGKHGSGEKR